MLGAYLDASTFDDLGIMTVAGFVGKANDWCQFWERWQAVRNREGVEFFRMSDLKSRRTKPFRDWTDGKRDDITGELSRLINQYAMFGIAITVSMTDWKARHPNLPPESAYIFSAAECVSLTAEELRDLRIVEPVFYIYERGDGGLPAFIKTMNRFGKASKAFFEAFQIHDVTDALKRNVPPLDSADFLAWQANHHVRLDYGRMPLTDPGYSGLPLNTNPWFGERIDIKILDHRLAGPYLDKWTDTPQELAVFLAEFGEKYLSRGASSSAGADTSSPADPPRPLEH